MEHPHLVHLLPCVWNRQLCTWWRDHGYRDVFDAFAYCNGAVKLYHGNCNTPIPDKWRVGKCAKVSSISSTNLIFLWNTSPCTIICTVLSWDCQILWVTRHISAAENILIYATNCNCNRTLLVQYSVAKRNYRICENILGIVNPFEWHPATLQQELNGG